MDKRSGPFYLLFFAGVVPRLCGVEALEEAPELSDRCPRRELPRLFCLDPVRWGVSSFSSASVCFFASSAPEPRMDLGKNFSLKMNLRRNPRGV